VDVEFQGLYEHVDHVIFSNVHEEIKRIWEEKHVTQVSNHVKRQMDQFDLEHYPKLLHLKWQWHLPSICSRFHFITFAPKISPYTYHLGRRGCT
jgi:hypothetical protein